MATMDPNIRFNSDRDIRAPRSNEFLVHGPNNTERSDDPIHLKTQRGWRIRPELFNSEEQYTGYKLQNAGSQKQLFMVCCAQRQIHSADADERYSCNPFRCGSMAIAKSIAHTINATLIRFV
jgi:hypothetical protein